MNIKKRPAQSPLVGNFRTGRRRIINPLRRVQTKLTFDENELDSELDSDDESVHWERDSIASEIMTCSDFDGIFANNSDF